jgi:hypothetical protein
MGRCVAHGWWLVKFDNQISEVSRDLIGGFTIAQYCFSNFDPQRYLTFQSFFSSVGFLLYLGNGHSGIIML